MAWGYSTDFFLSRLQHPATRWDAFDRFTGLPRPWRNHRTGDFASGGQPPQLLDPRVNWHTGDVEDRITKCDLSRDDDLPWLVLFDLDIYEPSLAVWQELKDRLRVGDIIYFDEAFDRDERHLLDHHVLPWGTYHLLGATPMALCLEVAK